MCVNRLFKMTKKQEDNSLILEYFVPIESKAEVDGNFTINGIAINETTTTNGHKFIGEELSKSAHTLIGVPILKDHDNSVDSIVGKVNVAHWDEALRNIPFSAIIKDTKVKQLINDGLLSTVSVGAHVRPEDIEETDDGDVIPHNIQFKELSVVAVPADGGATFTVALNNAYKSHSSKIDNSNKSGIKEDNMTEEIKKTETEEEVKPKAEVKDEVKVGDEVKAEEEEKALDESIKALEIKAKKQKLLALQEADADEVEPKAEAKEEAKEETKEAEAEEEDEEEDESEEEVEEKGDYTFTEGNKSIGIERKSYVYN